MAAYLAVVKDQASILRVASATLIYGAALLTLAVLACGGVRELRARFFYVWFGSRSGGHEEIGL